MNNRDRYSSWEYLAVDIGVFVCFDNWVYHGALKRDLTNSNRNKKRITYRFGMVANIFGCVWE
jgi:hypothetical protein